MLIGFHRQTKLLELNFSMRKTVFPLDCQTRHTKSLSQLVNMANVQPLLKSLECLNCIQMNNNHSIMYLQELIVNEQLRIDSNTSVT